MPTTAFSEKENMHIRFEFRTICEYNNKYDTICEYKDNY